MNRIRTVEEKIAELYPEQEMRCPVHLCIGQEAAEAGSCAALNDDDYVISGHRSHGHYLAKGGDLKAMLAEIYGKETGCAGGKGGSMHLIDLNVGFIGAAPIVGSTIPIGVGVAFASKLKKENRVMMIFLGDGVAEAGVFHESLNLAQLWNLPVIFVCENNLYSVYSPMHVRQPDTRRIVDLAAAHGMDSHYADGNDVEVVYQLTSDAVKKCRNGQGPVFIEFSTYRWREHCGPNFDNDIGYRTEDEYQVWRKRDPVALFRSKLINDYKFDESEIVKIEHDFKDQVNDAVKFAKESPFPDSSNAELHIYA